MFSTGDIVKSKDGRVLVVKNEIKNKVYLVWGIYDKENGKTANICLDKNYKLQLSRSYDIIKKNNASVVIGIFSECGGVEIDKKEGFYKFKIVCCKLEKEDNFVENSCCCDCSCN